MGEMKWKNNRIYSQCRLQLSEIIYVDNKDDAAFGIIVGRNAHQLTCAPKITCEGDVKTVLTMVSISLAQVAKLNSLQDTRTGNCCSAHVSPALRNAHMRRTCLSSNHCHHKALLSVSQDSSLN